MMKDKYHSPTYTGPLFLLLLQILFRFLNSSLPKGLDRADGATAHCHPGHGDPTPTVQTAPKTVNSKQDWSLVDHCFP